MGWWCDHRKYIRISRINETVKGDQSNLEVFPFLGGCCLQIQWDVKYISVWRTTTKVTLSHCNCASGECSKQDESKLWATYDLHDGIFCILPSRECFQPFSHIDNSNFMAGCLRWETLPSASHLVAQKNVITCVAVWHSFIDCSFLTLFFHHGIYLSLYSRCVLWIVSTRRPRFRILFFIIILQLSARFSIRCSNFGNIQRETVNGS